MSLPPRIVLFDGVCNFCDHTVQWLLSHDPEGRLMYAPLQGETAAAIRSRHPELPNDLDSILYVTQEGGREIVRWRSRAAFAIARELPGGWRALSYLGALPSLLTDLGYRCVAAVRYQIWGKKDACRIPRPDERARFLP